MRRTLVKPETSEPIVPNLSASRIYPVFVFEEEELEVEEEFVCRQFELPKYEPFM